jgi:predicted nicotinamide N-methyase
MQTPLIKYHTTIRQRKYGEKLFVLEVIRDLDEAIDQICDAMTEEEKLDPFAEDLCPYFGVLWPAAEGLASFLADHPALVKDQKVLELGAGLGLPSMVATYLGGRVLTTDFHPQAQEFFLRNCRHSVLKGEYQRLNWRESREEIGEFDLVMGSDVLYESKHPREIVAGLSRFLKPNGKILLSDPGRAYLKSFVSAMELAGFEWVHETSLINELPISVYQFVRLAK